MPVSPQAAIRARLAVNKFVNRTGQPIEEADFVLPLHALGPNEVPAVSGNLDSELWQTDQARLFDMVVCDITSSSGVIYSIGGPFENEIVFAGGALVSIRSYSCRIDGLMWA